MNSPAFHGASSAPSRGSRWTWQSFPEPAVATTFWAIMAVQDGQGAEPPGGGGVTGAATNAMLARCSGCESSVVDGQGTAKPMDPETKPSNTSSETVKVSEPDTLSMLQDPPGNRKAKSSPAPCTDGLAEMTRSSSVLGALPASKIRPIFPMAIGVLLPSGNDDCREPLPKTGTRQKASFPQHEASTPG